VRERENVTVKKIRLSASKRKHSPDTKKKTQSLVSNRQKETIARSSRKKRHYSVSKYKETISGQPAKRGRLCSKQKETLTCQQVRARECVRAQELERERTRVRARERTCMHEAAQERETARVSESDRDSGMCDCSTLKSIMQTLDLI